MRKIELRKSQSRAADLIDAAALRADIEALTAGKTPPEFRPAMIARLRQARTAALARAQELLNENGSGLYCAESLARAQDVLVRQLADVAVKSVYRVENPSKAERLAAVAVGGYGRGTLAPGSDVDLLFILPYKHTPWTETVVEFVLYSLWDLGLKVGHATRTIDECMRLSQADLTIRTAVLEARYLWGDEALFSELTTRFDREVAQGSAAEFVAAKLTERDERHRRQGQSRYLVEPNVKEGKGGLRDLNTLFWIAQYVYRVHAREELVNQGVFSRAELALFRKAEDFLWAVRCQLHFLTGRAEERLSFDFQREIAIRLGYTSHPGLRDVERFMKHYFLVAKDVGDLTRILCNALEEEQVKQAPGGFNRFLSTIRRRKRRALPETGDFVIEHERLNVVDEEVFARDPVNLIRLFDLAQRHELAFHPNAMRLARRSRALIDAKLRENPEANKLFLEILTSRRDPETILRHMNETGVLGRFIPDFGRVVAMMQFNMYHHYTVDEHLLRCIGALEEIERGERSNDLPIATRLMREMQNRRLIYVALFLHDIAKGRPEDHSVAGARIARRLCPRLGLSAAETDTIAWLIQNHLVMSMVAQSRDLSDPKTVADFAALVQSPERLKLLLILTVCDIKAVGPGVWNNWKAQLLRTLFYETEPRLAGGHSRVSHTERVAAAKAELADALSDWPEVERLAYLERHYRPYWLRVDIASKVAHAALVRQADRERRRLATAVEVRSRHDVTVITVLAPDHPRVLQVIAGACTVAGGNIVDAQIFTTTDGLALDSIAISREFADDNDETRRARRISDLIERALTGTETLPDRIARKLAGKPGTRPFTVPTEVHIDNASSEQFTVLEVAGLDRPGLLYDLTRALSDLNLNITSAHIATFGERVVDVFYLTGLAGQKITAASTQAAIRRRVHQAFEGTTEPPRVSAPAEAEARPEAAAEKPAADKPEARKAAEKAAEKAPDKTAPKPAARSEAKAEAKAEAGADGKGETRPSGRRAAAE